MKEHFKKIPGLVWFYRLLKSPFRKLREINTAKVARRDFERAPVIASSEDGDQELVRIENLLRYTKTSGSQYSALEFPGGYHTIEVNGRVFEGQRNPLMRLDDLPFSLEGKRVLDIGCNQGGMLFAIGEKIKWGVGVDYDPKMVNAANKIKSVMSRVDLSFYVFDIDGDPHGLIYDFIPEPEVDVVFLLSVAMWVDCWKDLVLECAKLSSCMVFETNGSPEQQRGQYEYLYSVYSEVNQVSDSSVDDPKQRRRRLYVCSQPRR
ncbi:bifunctional 2-polyprenyl-6-hydroxyphenol methylase/3-demethylubiquinol 3-O-methyltransferase UbiG [Halomonas sp.]|uniref:class I SAM-dependent methyltransferase n=1 Tax=Halomonas sp. TaxID=1486246 RepID=UPI0025C3CDAE|nr:class I SAM-dependent methyltransferase [Halomonas sp.]